jgi:hypothetical protein
VEAVIAPMLGWLSEASTLPRARTAPAARRRSRNRREDLDRDVAVERRVGRLPDGAHPTLAEFDGNAVVQEGRAGGDHGVA